MDSPSLSEPGKFLYHRYNLILTIEFYVKWCLKKQEQLGIRFLYVFIWFL